MNRITVISDFKAEKEDLERLVARSCSIYASYLELENKMEEMPMAIGVFLEENDFVKLPDFIVELHKLIEAA